ncbi:S9 family peptidase [Oceanobacter sp. 4_MG-2023]|uniref:alpha/beta hydrolase family protein n=1 Tax=Oceanobacter sp. 4_MG-2023 TaxID=3062623 RepID=UPI002733E5D6|nr:prolyl oligopeptidase family serine peptidase [Oceanobacter sp. 4_MG-2023]MDP2547307.1 prolyl oligopeptidase family serine peptidase [Oceanobacter sp. 4_MG-2023]
MMTAISAQQAAAQGKQWAELRSAGSWLGWLEFDPATATNQVLVAALDEQPLVPVVVSPAGMSARSRVHEYGGGSWCLFANGLIFVNEADQGLYLVTLTGDLQAVPVPQRLFVQPGCRYGDLVWDELHQRVLAVEEAHSSTTQEPVNRLVALALVTLPGQSVQAERHLLAEGWDFYASPTPAADGRYLAWLCWNHPHQPWLSTTLQRGELDNAGALLAVETVANPQQAEVSLCQPGFLGDELWVVSDQPGDVALSGKPEDESYWNLYRYLCAPSVASPATSLTAPPVAKVVHAQAAEFATAQWQLGLRHWVAGADGVVASFFQQGEAGIGWLNRRSGVFESLLSPDHKATARYHSLCWNTHSGRYYALRECWDSPTQLVSWDLSVAGEDRTAEGLIRLDIGPMPQTLTRPQRCMIPAPGTAEQTLFGWYYPPTAATDVSGNAYQPGLIIQLHGGPTAMADSSFDPQKQFWCDRGYGLLMLNYRGSSGFGRRYRQALAGQWGLTDVDDVLLACQYAQAQGWAQPGRILVRGNSAGGYTVLRVLSDDRAAAAGIGGGASLYGISDLALLNAHTHKFESRYLHWLIGDPVMDAQRYRQRSPIFRLDHFRLPVIFFQGQQDRVVPPPQTRRLFEALQARSVITDYVLFKGEGHGFRQQKNRATVLQREDAFYQQLLGADADGLG